MRVVVDLPADNQFASALKEDIVDLTDALDEAPHDAGLLERFPVIGILAE